jgi:ferrous iron transport protein A
VSLETPSPLVDWNVSPPVAAARPSVCDGRDRLAALPPGTSAAVVRVALDGELVRWLEAIGIGAGDRVTVLRRAAFGGPIHLRTQTGGEFAVDRSLAASIHVEADAAAPDPTA